MPASEEGSRLPLSAKRRSWSASPSGMWRPTAGPLSSMKSDAYRCRAMASQRSRLLAGYELYLQAPKLRISRQQPLETHFRKVSANHLLESPEETLKRSTSCAEASLRRPGHS